MLELLDSASRVIDLNRDLRFARQSVREIEQGELCGPMDGGADWLRAKLSEFSEVVGKYLRVFELTKAVEKDWRRAVYRGEEDYSEQVDAAIFGLYGVWLGVAESFIERAVFYDRHAVGSREQLARVIGEIEGNKREATSILQVWRAPTATAAPSFRKFTVSPQGVDRIKEMVTGLI